MTELPAFPWTEAADARSETVALQNVFLHVTKACNLRCSYCYSSARRALPDELTTDELKALWPGMVRLRPAKVVFTGGEPLLRPDLVDLLRAFEDVDAEHRVLRCLNTNGHPIDARVADSLVGLVDEIRVSLDGDAERNDRLRGKGNFSAAWTALRLLHEVGFEPKVLVTVTSESLDGLEEFLCLLLENGYLKINLNLFRPLGRGLLHPEWTTPLDDVRQRARRAWERSFPDIKIPERRERPADIAHCGAGRFINIMSNGDVYPCHVLSSPEFRLGNLRENALEQICARAGLLGRLASLDFRRLAQQDPDVEHLLRRYSCLGSVYAGTRESPLWNGVLKERIAAPKGGRAAPPGGIAHANTRARGREERSVEADPRGRWTSKVLAPDDESVRAPRGGQVGDKVGH